MPKWQAFICVRNSASWNEATVILKLALSESWNVCPVCPGVGALTLSTCDAGMRATGSTLTVGTLCASAKRPSRVFQLSGVRCKTNYEFVL